MENKEDKTRVFVSDILSSKLYLKEGQIIAATSIVKESKGEGIINQILFKTNSTAYTLQVIIDKELLYDKLYSFFATNSTDIDNVSAYTAGGFYYLTIQNLLFQKRFLIRIIPTASITFTLTLIRYNIRDEQILKEL